MSRRTADALRGEGGFTLIELLVTVVIVVILSLAVRAAVEGYITKSRIARCQTELAEMRMVVQQYYVANEAYPTIQEIAAVMQSSGIRWNQADPNGLKDPWKQPYFYYVPSSTDPNRYYIISKGPDKQFGTGDEVYASLFGVAQGKVSLPAYNVTQSSK